MKPIISIITIIFLLFYFVIVTNVWATTPPVTFQVLGIKDPEKKNVILMLNKKLVQTAGITDQERLQTFFQRSSIYITDALKPYGYFEPSIAKHLFKHDGKTFMSFNISLGKKVFISQVSVQILGDGIHDPKFQQLLTKLPVKVGQSLNADRYQMIKNSLSNLASQHGYFNAKFVKSQMIINLNTHQAQINMIYDTNQRYRFGPTYFCGSTLRQEFLKRYLLYGEGDYYNNLLIQRLQQDLSSSYYFKQVTVTPKLDEAQDGTIPVNVNLIPNNPRQYIFGLGYGTDTGVRATLGLQIRQVNDRGDYFNTILRAAQTDSVLSSNYVIPGKRPAYDFYTLNAAVGSINQSTGKSNSYKFGPSYTTQVKPRWDANMGTYFLDEHYHLEDEPSTDAQLIVSYFHLEHKHRQALINPSKGYNLSFNVAGGPSTANFSESFIQEKMQGKALYTANKTHTRFITRGELGRTDIDNINHLPLSLQLYAGGTNSIRGYSYNSIGPGRNLLVGSAEVQQKIYKSFYLAAFYDVGSVGNKDYLSELKQGVGPGLVVLSPIGSFELTIARRIANGIDHPSYQIQFSMGPDL